MLWGKMCSQFLEAQCQCLFVYLNQASTRATFTHQDCERHAASCMDVLDVAGGLVLVPLFDCMRVLMPMVCVVKLPALIFFS